MNKITLIGFYQKLSSLLEDYRHEKVSYDYAKKEIENLNNLATANGLDVSASLDLLHQIEIFDDERSYEPKNVSLVDNDEFLDTESSYE